MEKLPVLSADLIAELDKMFPEKSPDPSQTDREIWIQVGERGVVRMLLAKLAHLQEDNPLES